jgi:hypothetical protein
MLKTQRVILNGLCSLTELTMLYKNEGLTITKVLRGWQAVRRELSATAFLLSFCFPFRLRNCNESTPINNPDYECQG